MALILGILREVRPGERRVALIPESLQRLGAKGFTAVVEAGAGDAAAFPDPAFAAAGATILAGPQQVLDQANVVVRVNALTVEEIAGAQPDAVAVSLLFPLVEKTLVAALRDRPMTAIALDRIPRTTLAQSMDVLSSQSTVAGYRAAVLAAASTPRFFPLLMTAAGRVDPAKVLVLGAGVAGLQAIATARRLGALVEAYDVRAAVKEQVESLGATFVDVGEVEDAETKGGYAKEISAASQQRVNDVIAEHLRSVDCCITTALIPGRPAPRLISADMVAGMKAGSVIVDMAAEQGGNCELTQPGVEVTVGGTLILGPTNLPSELACDASKMFSRNVEKLLLYLARGGSFDFDFKNEIVRGCVVTHQGKVVDPQVAELFADGRPAG